MKKNPKNIDEIKIDNITSVFNLIRVHNGITRVMIAEKLSLTRMSITRIVGLLIEKNFVHEEGEIIPARGRPAKMLHINADAAYFFTANIDVDGISIAVLNLMNEICMETFIDAIRLQTMEEYVDSIHKVFKQWEMKHSDIFQKIKSVAFSTPGIIDPVKGEILISAQLGWKNVRIVEYATSRFNMKTIIDNDVKSALLGELSTYDMEKEENIAYICIGYGLGVGVWNEGKILRGAHNNAGEIGHISIDYHGKLCSCGRRGCLDTVLNINSILENAKVHDATIGTLEEVMHHYRKKDSWAMDLVDDVSMYFSMVVNNIIHAYDPEKIIVGGKLFTLFPEIRKPMLTSSHMDTNMKLSKNIRIEESRMGESAYLIGASINAQSWLFEKEFLV